MAARQPQGRSALVELGVRRPGAGRCGQRRGEQNGGPPERSRIAPRSHGEEPMTAVLEGVRILEVAEHTFVPAASALLADWGAEVIKIEHVERGDAMRGLASTGVVEIGRRRPRAARALEPRQAEPRPRPHLRRRAATSSTSSPPPPTCSSPTSCPSVRTKLQIDVDDIRAAQPEHHLRAGHRPGRARSRRRQGLLRLARVLGRVRHRHRASSARVRPRRRPARPRASATRSAP